jgi:hypothetical protein
MNQKHMEKLRPAKQRFRLLRTNLPMGMSQVAIVRANESNTPLAMEIGLVTTDAPGQDTNGLTDRELDHEPCLPAIP